MNGIIGVVKYHWGKFALAVLLVVIVGLAVRPGQFILGNDNYSPELNPQLTLSRSVENPAWRSYRILGVPSDSEQADIVRSAVFTALQSIVPLWVLSQGYVFLSFMVGCFTVGFLAITLFLESHTDEKREAVFFISGALYAMNLVAWWMMYAPLKVFLAGYAFLPFILWRLVVWIRKPSPFSALWLFISVFCLTTSAMVPTTFLVESGLIVFVACWELFACRRRPAKTTLLAVFGGGALVFGTQLFWILPFISYVRTNSAALQESYINRALTPGFIQSELTYNTFANTVRYYFSWISITNDDGTAQFQFRNWFLSHPFAMVASYLPVVLTGVGAAFVLFKKQWRNALGWLLISYGIGLILIVGVHPPFGSLFSFLQKNIPLFEQVFRWQSSKLYPLMVIPMSVLGAYGAVFLASVWKKTGRFLTYGVIVGVLCVLFWPYFTGNLVSEGSFQTVPFSYWALASYLKTSAITERIYLAPEANTLYFRNYSWGFFGSSFLNYVIPNPIVEKALTTGSTEGEDAQRVMEEAVYSGDQTAFVRALQRYQTPYVLLDTSATRLHNGYIYDWKVFDQAIVHNPALRLVWHDASLYLYTVVSQDEDSTSLYSLYDGHNIELLNTFFAYTKNPQRYLTQPDMLGSIYPFALSFSHGAKEDVSWITETTTYHGQPHLFTWNVEASPSSFPTSIQRSDDGTQLVLTPAFPQLQVNDRLYTLPTEKTTYPAPPAMAFLSAGTDVFSPPSAHQIRTVTTAYGKAQEELRWWSSQTAATTAFQGTEKKYQFQLSDMGIVSLSLTLTALDQPGMVNICVWSNTTYDCVNKEQSRFLSTTPQTVTLTLPRIIAKGELLDVYIEPVQSHGAIHTQGTLTHYTQFNSFFSGQKERMDNTVPVSCPLATGDTLTVRIPNISGWSSYHYTPSAALQPAIPQTSCDDTGSSVRVQEEGLRLTASRCPAQFSVALKRIKPPVDSLGMLFVSGTNTSGIPLLIHIQKEKDDRSMQEDRFRYKTDTHVVLPVWLPSETVSYTLSAYAYGEAAYPSVNTLTGLSFQFIPRAWFTWSLLPADAPVVSADAVRGTNQAYHAGWQLSSQGDCHPLAVRINGWEQGWIDASQCGTTSVFGPSQWVYVGYGISACIIGGFLLVWPLVRRIGSKKTAQKRM